MNEYPKTIAEVGEAGAAQYLHIAPEDRAYQRGWDDGYALRPMFAALVLDEDYFDGYNAGLDEAEAEGR